MTTAVLRRPRSGRGERRWPLARIFLAGATIAALVAIIAIALGAVALARLSAARTALVDVAAPAGQAAAQLAVALVDQETGVRGFDITGSADFLGPYQTGVIDQRVAEDTLRRLAAGHPDVTADLDAVDAAMAGWHTVYADPVLARSATAASPDQGRMAFDRVRAALATLQQDIDGQRTAARASLDTAAAFVTAIGIAIAALIAAFLVAAAVGLRRGVLRPMSQLAAQVRDVVSKDVQQPVRADGPREIVELGEDVEAMRVRIMHDLDEAQQTNRRLDEQARELERSNRDLEQFAYVASHDLQEPLRKVSSFCQLLQRRYGGQLDERADQYIAFAVDGAGRMQQLINDLLAFSRVGRTTAGFEPVDIGGIVTAARAELEAARAESAGEIEAGPLPVVRGDPALLRRLMVNLIGNALKFRREDVPPCVRICARRADDGWEITVSDNGIGIEPEYAEKVFVIFQRLHARDVYAGTGIGLALAKKIVEFHGGRIGIDDPGPEPGTTVRFTLPAVPEETHE